MVKPSTLGRRQKVSALGFREWKAEATISWLWLPCLAKLPGFAQDSVARLTQHPKKDSY